MKYLAVIVVLHTLSACTAFDSEPPMQGWIEAGLYHHPLGHFTCPIPNQQMGFDRENLRIVDAWRDQYREPDPFSSNPLFKERLVVNGIKPDSGATFRDGPRVGTASIVKIIPGGMIHGRDDVLSTYFGSGFAKPLDTAYFSSRHGDVGYQLALVPWYDPEQSYMGANLLADYMADDKKAPPDLVATLNVIHGETHYHVEWKINVGPILPLDMHRRDLPKILRYIESQPERVSRMRQVLTQWFESCDITDFIAGTGSKGQIHEVMLYR